MALLLLFLQLKTDFVQVSPSPSDKAKIERWDGQTRAIVLLAGIKPHPFSAEKVERPEFHAWQESGADLVKILKKEGDVFAFAYSQNVALDDIAASADLRAAFKRLKDAGYAELVLVGHSAGGLIARQFVEDNADHGVAKIVQVCTPNRGSTWGKSTFAVRENQEAFLKSLSKEARAKRTDKKIPTAVDFACIVGDVTGIGDVVVSDEGQWPEDLRKQGIPAVQVRTDHYSAMRDKDVANKIAELVREKQGRWDEKKIDAARKEILGD